ncbi:MAG: GIY-YIG nuclease family protein [Flavobacteriales bacterium]
MIHQYWVYMVTNKGNTTLYAGVMNDPQRRLFEHRTRGVAEVVRLAIYSAGSWCTWRSSDINVAIRRETRIELEAVEGRADREGEPELG